MLPILALNTVRNAASGGANLKSHRCAVGALDGAASASAWVNHIAIRAAARLGKDLFARADAIKDPIRVAQA